jgi:hypothetical protein
MSEPDAIDVLSIPNIENSFHIRITNPVHSEKGPGRVKLHPRGEWYVCTWTIHKIAVD